jgi:hypothetical protein
MSTIPGIQSRGPISENDFFHMVGIIRKGTAKSKIPTFLHAIPGLNTGTETTEDRIFMLCACDTPISNDSKSINNESYNLYWSCDPTDFVPDNNFNSLTQGIATLKYTKNGNNFNLSFIGSNKLQTKGIVPKFPSCNLNADNLNKCNKNNTQPTNFTFFIKNNENLVRDQIFADVVYTVGQSNPVYETKPNPILWNFRKMKLVIDTSTGTHVSIAANTSTADSVKLFRRNTTFTNFQAVNKPQVNFSGNKIQITQDLANLNFSITKTDYDTYRKQFERFQENNSVVVFKKGSDKRAVKYRDFIPQGTKHIFEYSRSADAEYYDTSGTVIGTPGADILFEIKNDPFGFQSVDADSDTPVSGFMDIFFIPSTFNAHFPGGMTLDASEHFLLSNLVPPTTFTIYNPSTGSNSVSTTPVSNHFNQRFYRRFSTLYVLDIMSAWTSSSFWTNDTEQGFATISVNPNNNNFTKCSLYTWTLLGLAYHDYEFNYCVKPQTCGNCYGNGPRSSVCYPRDDAKAVAAASSLGVNSKQVFITPNTNTRNLTSPDKNEYIPLYIVVGVMGFIILILLITHGHYRKKVYHKMSSVIGKNLLSEEEITNQERNSRKTLVDGPGVPEYARGNVRYEKRPDNNFIRTDRTYVGGPGVPDYARQGLPPYNPDNPLIDQGL